MEKRKDIFGNTPEIGDIIAFVPASYKQMIYGECVDFAKSGLLILKINPEFGYTGQNNTPKSGFVVYYKNN